MRRINVTVPGDLVARAKAAGLNLSEVTRNAFAEQLAGTRSGAPTDDGSDTKSAPLRGLEPHPCDPQ
jgi:hypothetical protein